MQSYVSVHVSASASLRVTFTHQSVGLLLASGWWHSEQDFGIKMVIKEENSEHINIKTRNKPCASKGGGYCATFIKYLFTFYNFGVLVRFYVASISNLLIIQ